MRTPFSLLLSENLWFAVFTGCIFFGIAASAAGFREAATLAMQGFLASVGMYYISLLHGYRARYRKQCAENERRELKSVCEEYLGSLHDWEDAGLPRQGTEYERRIELAIGALGWYVSTLSIEQRMVSTNVMTLRDLEGRLADARLRSHR